MVAALEAAIERDAEVVCLQEPYVGKKNSASHPGFQIRWPESAGKETRVALAIRNDVLDRYVFEERTDLVDSPYVQCLDIWETQWRRRMRRTRLVNIYNRARMEGGGYAIDRIDLPQLVEGRTILTGDFNARSPAWDPWAERRCNAGTTEQLIEEQGLIVNNNDQPTRHGKKCRSIIDLTLSSPRLGRLATWEIDADLATPSDHEVIVFSWTPLNPAGWTLDEPTRSAWNIDKLLGDETRLEQAAAHWHELDRDRPCIGACATPEDVEHEALWIGENIKTVLNTHAPGKTLHARSKRWWTDEVKEERRRFSQARRKFKEQMLHFAEYRQIRNAYYCHVRKAKREMWERFLEGVFPTDDDAQRVVDSGRCWKALRYTKPHMPSYTPAIKIGGVGGEPDKVVANAEGKEEVFMKQAFPCQTDTGDDITIPDTAIQLDKKAVHEALFAQSVIKAPGPDGITFKTLRLLWRWAEGRIVSLVQRCIVLGYQPRAWKTAKGVLLRKHGKPTYTVAKAYRVISLLNCLGKVVERVVASWIASYCEAKEVFHCGQFGSRKARGTSDAVSRLVATVEEAWGRKQMALALLLDVKGAYDRVNKRQLLLRMIEVGIAGNIVRWVESFMSDRRAMLVMDGRVGETYEIQAGLPQGSPVSPVLFILSISGLFPWLEEQHSGLQSISFVDDLGLVLSCDSLDEGVQELEGMAEHAIEWGTANKVEFEVSKTEVLVFSKKRKVLQAAKEAVVNVGEQSFAIKQGATKWLGFWLDSKLSFKTHFEKRMTSARGALQAIANLSTSNGGLSIRLMRRVVVATVNSIALFGAEVWWRGQRDREKKLQVLLNRQARAITGLLKSTPIPFLLKAACLPYAKDLLDQRQTQFAVRALGTAQEHPTHQLLPANFRFGELYRHEGASGVPSSVGWARPDKTHRLLGGRLAQQVSRHVTYDTEHGFDLLERMGKHGEGSNASVDRQHAAPSAVPLHSSDKVVLLASGAKGTSFGAAVGWKAGNRDRVKTKSLGKFITIEDAEQYAIHMAINIAQSLLLRTGRWCIEIMTGSSRAPSAINKAGHWSTPVVRDIKNQIGILQGKGGLLTLSTPPTDEDTERMECIKAAAMHAAAQQPKAMRSASLAYVKQSIKSKWKPAAKISKAVNDGKKSVTARYLQLKSGHAVIGVHLLRIKKAQDARCWWCDSSRQTVGHLLMECRKWRRERETMLKGMQHKKIEMSLRRDASDLQLLLGDNAAEAVLGFLEHTAVGKRKDDTGAKLMDAWETDRLDRDDATDGEESEREQAESEVG